MDRLDDAQIAKLAQLVQRAAQDVGSGDLPSCQLALARNGQIVMDITLGRPSSARYLAYSCTKAVTASAVWLLLQEGELTTGTLVADLVPGFGANGKDAVTVEHLLTHTAGFPDAPLTDEQWSDPATRVNCFGHWQAQWAPGERYEYHGRSASWVLAHLIEVVTGEDFREFIRTRVIEAVGLNHSTLGTLAEPGTAAHERALEVAEPVTVGDPPDESAAEALGLDISAIGTDQASLLEHADPAVRKIGQPSGGMITTASDLATFYQALLGNVDGPWTQQTLALGTSEIRCTLGDPMTSVPANRTLGLVVAGDDGHAMMRGLGRGVSASAFGHMGAGGQIAWADPATGVSFAYLTNGLVRDPVQLGIRSDELSTAAGRCFEAPAEGHR